MLSSESDRYVSILRSVASGNHRVTDIADYLGISATSLMRPIDRLMMMGLIGREVPATDDHSNKRNGLYFVREHSISFWCRHSLPYASDLQMGCYDRAMEAWDRRSYEDAE